MCSIYTEHLTSVSVLQWYANLLSAPVSTISITPSTHHHPYSYLHLPDRLNLELFIREIKNSVELLCYIQQITGDTHPGLWRTQSWVVRHVHVHGRPLLQKLEGESGGTASDSVHCFYSYTTFEKRIIHTLLCSKCAI